MREFEPAQNHLCTVVIPVRWGDMDANKHVNNTVFFRYYEQVRMHWLDELGYSLSASPTEGPVIVDAYCTFLQPIHYPESLRVSFSGGAPGRSSFTGYYAMCSDSNPEKVYSTGHSKIVWVDQTVGKSKPLPDKIRAYLPETSQ